MPYLGFQKNGQNFGWSLVLTQWGANHVFLFFPMVKNIFLPKGTMAQCPPPKYATVTDECDAVRLKSIRNPVESSAVNNSLISIQENGKLIWLRPPN